MVQATTFNVQWFNNIDQVSIADWQACFPEDDILRSHDLQRAYETSNFRDVNFHYCVITQENRVVGILPCFEYRISLTDVASVSTQNIVARIRKICPNFLKVKAFVAGAPISICDDLIGIHQNYRSNLQSILSVAFSAIEQRCNQTNSTVTLIKEIRNRYQSVLFQQIKEDFIIGESPPTTFTYVGEINGEPYLQRLRNRYRSSIKGYLKKFSNRGLHWELVSDFGDLSETLCELYLNVLNRSKVKFEQLTPDFFKSINTIMGERSAVLVGYHQEKIVAMELILQGRQMHPIYLGMDYQYLNDSGLYFNCLVKLLQEAQDRQCYTVELGQTSYEAKSNFGIELEKLYVAIKHKNPTINKLLRRFKHQILPSYPEIPARNIFKDSNAHSAHLDQAIIPSRAGY